MQSIGIEELEISKARQEFSRLDDYLAERKSHVLYVKRHKKAAFAVVDVEFLDALLETLEVLQDPEARALLAAGLEDLRAGRTVSQEEVKKQLL